MENKRNFFNGILRLAVVSVFGAVSTLFFSCQDTPFYGQSSQGTDRPVFDISVMSDWTAGVPVTRNAHARIYIDPLDCDYDGEKLYLVSEVTEINDSVKKTVASSTRGESVGTLDKFYNKYGNIFGLYAVCYVNDEEKAAVESPKENVVPNMACNNCMSWSKGEENGISYSDLEWPQRGTLRFRAYAPYPTSTESYGISPSGKSDRPSLAFEVKESVEDQIDLLVASPADVKDGYNDPVKLEFGHALSAISFKTGKAMLAGTISEVKITGVKGSGSYDLLTGTWTPTGENKDFCIDFEDNKFEGKEDKDPYANPGQLIAGGKDTPDGNDDLLTLFMIPQDLTDASVTITFTDDFSGMERTLTARLGGNVSQNETTEKKSWDKGKHYVYSLSTTGVVINPVVKITKKGSESYVFADSIPFTGVVKDVEVTSYVEITQASAETVNKAVPFTIEYSLDGENWSSKTDKWGVIWQVDKPSTVEPYAVSDKSDIIDTQTGTLYLPPQDLFKERQEKSFGNMNDDGSYRATNTYDDLSDPESANCYMVREPGYYKFRTVYGNSWKGGENRKSFEIIRTEGDGHTPGMKWFVDHANKQIISPYIKTQAGTLKDAFVLWQDSPGLIDEVKLDADGDYISFHVDKHTIAQGNAVIALANNAGDIVWSWHIWVTDQDWSETINLENDEGEKFRMAPSMIGRCDNSPGTTARTIYLRVVFDIKDADGKKLIGKTVNVGDNNYDLSKGIGQKYMAASLGGDNTYYQWGRKDAMPGGRYGLTNGRSGYKYYTSFSGRNEELTMLNKEIFDNPKKYKLASYVSHGVSFGYVIKHPHHFILGIGTSDGVEHRTHWHNPSDAETSYIEAGKPSMYNAWNSNAKKAYSNDSPYADEGWIITKTIYDPCPPGFHVPAAVTFSGMLNKSADATKNYASESNQPVWSAVDNCWTLKSRKDGTGEEIKIYATGVRDMNFPEGEIKDNNPFGISKNIGSSDGISWPAFSMIAYIATSSTGEGLAAQTHILYFDHRGVTVDGTTLERCGWGITSNNSYGFSVWPVED